jgi:hypothetical protein
MVLSRSINSGGVLFTIKFEVEERSVDDPELSSDFISDCKYPLHRREHLLEWLHRIFYKNK